MYSHQAGDPNRNVNWMSGKGVWTFYILLIAAFRIVLSFFPITAMTAWTTTNVCHGVFMFFLLHWVKGSPVDDYDQGEYADKTWWEQMDQGRPWTTNKKFLMLVAVALFLLASHHTVYDLNHLLINTFVCAVNIVAKLPEMHKVRIFGINKTVGLE